MSKVKFIPSVNGVGPHDYRRHFRRLPIRASGRVIDLASARVLQDLEADYFGAVEFYNLAKHLAGWGRSSELEDHYFLSGLIFVLLDFFNAGLYLPADIGGLSRSRRRSLEDYFWRRSQDNLHTNSEAYIKAQAISTLLPDEWYPEAVLKRQIKSELKRLRVYRDVEIDAELGLAPGGLTWLGKHTRAALTRLLDSEVGRLPRPIRLIQSPQLARNRQVIVYGAFEESDTRIRLDIFEPGCICEDHAIFIEMDQDRPVIYEACPPGPPTRIGGLVCDEYVAQTPPDDCLTPVQQNAMLRKVAWRVRRWRR